MMYWLKKILARLYDSLITWTEIKYTQDNVDIGFGEETAMDIERAKNKITSYKRVLPEDKVLSETDERINEFIKKNEIESVSQIETDAFEAIDKALDKACAEWTSNPDAEREDITLARSAVAHVSQIESEELEGLVALGNRVYKG